MFRSRLGWLVVFSLCCVSEAGASSFGYSLNINFGADQQPVRDAAGIFRDRVWNNFEAPTQDRLTPIIADLFGDRNQSAAELVWNAPAVRILDSVKPNNPEDGRLMRGFLDSPSRLVLQGLDQVVPDQRGPVTYSVILYTFGGRDGEPGTYKVNGRERDRIDSPVFDGKFTQGIQGNTLIFKDLVDPVLVIDTDRFGPINAMSLIYCRPGDFDGDGIVDVTDLKKLNEAFKAGSNELAFDVNFDLTVDFKDVLSWIKCSKGTCIGDVNLDGVFDSSDLIELFQNGAYERDELADWTQGDWNGDCKFDSSDLLVAFQEGCYQSEGLFAKWGSLPSPGADAGLMSVPEPSAAWLMGLGLLLSLAASGRPVARQRSRSDV